MPYHAMEKDGTADSVYWQRYWLGARGILVWFIAWTKDLSLFQGIPAGSGIHPVSRSLSTGGTFSGVEGPDTTRVNLLPKLRTFAFRPIRHSTNPNALIARTISPLL